MDEKTKPTDFMRPGHIFPLRAKTGGVLKRAGHTEAAIDLTKLAGLKEGGVICEIMNEDGTMARLPELVVLAQKLDLKIISIEDLINYQLKKGDLVNEIEHRNVKTVFGEFDFHAFQEKHTDQIHFALTKGSWELDEPVLVSRLINGEEPQLERISNMIHQEGKGALIFINNVSNAELTMRKLQQFLNYQDGQVIRPTLSANFVEYGIGTQILKKLGITKFRVITKNTAQKPILSGYGVEITEMVQM
jgi:3,4-dihydroxy 2-butanone 4-phosphate synthase/GTP cyclohydrolase II